MRPPPFLLGATLLFWGWQSGLILVGSLMAVVLEGSRLIKVRWEFSEEDFSRVWVFCSILLLAAVAYAFATNEGPSNFSNFFRNPSPGSGSIASTSSARTAASVLRWLPMIFFPFMAAETFSIREAIPLKTISVITRWRWKKAKELGGPLPAAQDIHIGYPYFGLTLLAASVHPGQNMMFFWGLCGFLTWVLWVQRSRRFAIAVWITALGVTITLAYYGQRGIGNLQRYIDSLNPQLFSRFARQSFNPTQSRTMLGNIGELKTSKRIVIRLKPGEGNTVPTYLRAATYRNYRPRIWFTDQSNDGFIALREEPPSESGNWPLLPDKTNTAVVNIACYLQGYSRESGAHVGLLPLPTGCGRLEHLPVYTLQKNGGGVVLADGPGLVMFDARFGPGATIDSPPNTNEDLEVFPTEIPALDKVISELDLKDQSLGKVLQTLGVFFVDKFKYSTWQERPRIEDANETPLTRFLLATRSGHCEYFATATVLLLRRLEIPARYAVGYFVHETSGHSYVVRESDAHAWCLVWDQDKGIWRNFDTTPPTWVATGGVHASFSQWLSDLWSRIKFEFAKFWWNQGGIRQYLLWLFVPVLALLLYQIIFRRGRKRQRKLSAVRELPNDWPGLDSEFYLLEKKLAARGVPRGSSEPLSDWLLRVLDTPDLTELRGPLQEVLRLHYRYRFDPLGLSETDREALRREARQCLDSLEYAKEPAAK